MSYDLTKQCITYHLRYDKRLAQKKVRTITYAKISFVSFTIKMNTVHLIIRNAIFLYYFKDRPKT